MRLQQVIHHVSFNLVPLSFPAAFRKRTSIRSARAPPGTRRALSGSIPPHLSRPTRRPPEIADCTHPAVRADTVVFRPPAPRTRDARRRLPAVYYLAAQDVCGVPVAPAVDQEPAARAVAGLEHEGAP